MKQILCILLILIIMINDFISVSMGAYTSPVTGRRWTTRTTDMQLIDATRNSDEPTQVALNALKRACKNYHK